MSLRDHFQKFAPKGKERVLPSESHQIVCLGMLDGFDIAVEDMRFLQKGFVDVSCYPLTELHSVKDVSS